MKKKSLIASPCISVCTINEETGFCFGCKRSFDEIAGWDDFNDARKQQVLDRIRMQNATIPI